MSGILAPWLSARAARLAESESAAATALFSETAVTALDHAAELRVAGRLDDVVARAEAADDEAVRAADRAAKPAAFAAAATPLAIGASVLGSLLIGITLYGTDGGAPGAMTPMSLAILVLVPLAAFEATGALPAAAVALTRARIASTRILELLDRAGEARPGGSRTPPDPADVRARDLRCGWPDGDKVTAPLDLDLPPGARIAVVGGSGAGKTTLLMTVAGLLPPVSGTVTVDGVPLADFRPDDLRREIGFFAEDAHLFDTSVLENLRVARGDLTEDDALSALRTVGLGEWVTRLPRGCTRRWVVVRAPSRVASAAVCCWRGHSSRRLGYCCSTSRPSTSTRPTARRSCASCSTATARWSTPRGLWCSSRTSCPPMHVRIGSSPWVRRPPTRATVSVRVNRWVPRRGPDHGRCELRRAAVCVATRSSGLVIVRAFLRVTSGDSSKSAPDLGASFLDVRPNY